MGSSSSTEACQSNPILCLHAAVVGQKQAKRVILAFYPMTFLDVVLLEEGRRRQTFCEQRLTLVNAFTIRPSCGKWVRERTFPNPICGETGRLGPIQRSVRGELLCGNARHRSLTAPAISDNRDDEKLNHERRDKQSKRIACT